MGGLVRRAKKSQRALTTPFTTHVSPFTTINNLDPDPDRLLLPSLCNQSAREVRILSPNVCLYLSLA